MNAKKPPTALKPKELPPPRDADRAGAEPDPKVRARVQHAYLLAGAVYGTQVRSVVGPDDATTIGSAERYAVDLFARLAPRDPLEEMLVGQMLQTHARLTYLSAYAAQQQSVKWAALMHEAADRAANTFRRQMLAFAEYRNPKPPPRSVTRIGQANIAHQQVVQNVNNPGAENATNEQGSAAGQGRAGQAPPALPADGGRAGGPPGGGRADQAVAQQQRAADGRGEGR